MTALVQRLPHGNSPSRNGGRYARAARGASLGDYFATANGRSRNYALNLCSSKVVRMELAPEYVIWVYRIVLGVSRIIKTKFERHRFQAPAPKGTFLFRFDRNSNAYYQEIVGLSGMRRTDAGFSPEGRTEQELIPVTILKSAAKPICKNSRHFLAQRKIFR